MRKTYKTYETPLRKFLLEEPNFEGKPLFNKQTEIFICLPPEERKPSRAGEFNAAITGARNVPLRLSKVIEDTIRKKLENDLELAEQTVSKFREVLEAQKDYRRAASRGQKNGNKHLPTTDMQAAAKELLGSLGLPAEVTEKIVNNPELEGTILNYLDAKKNLEDAGMSLDTIDKNRSALRLALLTLHR